MYNTGIAGFLTAACNPNRVVDAKAVITLSSSVLNLGANEIASYKVTSSSVAGKAFVPGSFVATQLEMSLVAASPAVARVDFKTNAVLHIVVYAGIQANSMVYVPLGKFYPDKDGVTVSDDGYISIRAMDIPQIMSGQFQSSILSLPCTVSAALAKIADATGLSISASTTDFPNLSVQLLNTFSLMSTYREALMYIAEAVGAYVSMNRSGDIQLKKMFSGLVNIGCELDDNYLFSVEKQESSVKPFQYIGIKANKDDLGVTQDVSGISTNCRYDIFDNPLTYGHPEDFLTGLVNPLTFSEFYPSKLSFHGRPDLELGDVVTYQYKGVSYILPICTHVFEYSGGFKTTIESIGSDVLNSSSIDSGTKAQMSALKQNLNILIRDLNQTQSQITAINGDITKVSEMLQTVESLKTQISKAEGEITKLSTLTQTAENLRLEIKTVADDLKNASDKANKNQATLLSYFDFQASGLVIGLSSSNIKLKLANDKIQFLKDDTTEVAYFSEGQLYVTDAHFLKSLVLGNFEFAPRTNGNLSLRLRG